MRIGILGGGQLGRMIALAGLPWDLSFRVLDPSRTACAAAVAEHLVGEYEDYAALADFVAGLDVVTYEFENVPVETAHWLSLRVPVYPPPEALEVAHDRYAEKLFFTRIGIPVPPYRAVTTLADFDEAVSEIGLPAVLKTRRFGYDGKGQTVLRTQADIEPAWTLLGGRPLILEQFVRFEREVSLLGVRGKGGEQRFYPLVENHHRDGILDRSIAPDPNNGALQALAEQHVGAALNALSYVGVFAIEFFVVGDGLFANEMAPRVHNSGHWTIEGAVTSQFENHLRAVIGWPLGETSARGCSAMINLIGQLPARESVLAFPGAHLHQYGKAPRPGRKLGHVTLLADDHERLAEQLKHWPSPS
jgi:5-(carboxyamino)imidazole ribonucleotide synthase